MKYLENKTLVCSNSWTEDHLNFTEVIRQEYGGNNCIISAGFVEGPNKPSEDTIYLRLEKDNIEPTMLLLRSDEAQAIAWVMCGVVWSHLMNEKPEAEGY